MDKTNFFLVLFLIAFVVIVFFRFGVYLASGVEMNAYVSENPCNLCLKYCK